MESQIEPIIDKKWHNQSGGIYFGHLAGIDADGDLDIAGPRTYRTGPIEI